ncbi:hypothetical protein B5S50_18905 [Clostridium sp. 001]|nr:hypothetical protein B5S50_18905 [Clostridium sp. 001]
MRKAENLNLRFKVNRFLFRVLFLPLSLDELSRGVANVSSHFDRSGSITVGSHQTNNFTGNKTKLYNRYCSYYNLYWPKFLCSAIITLLILKYRD